LGFGFWDFLVGGSLDLGSSGSRMLDLPGRFLLEPGLRATYGGSMKRILFLIISLPLCASPAARSQDAATEERLNKISGQLEDLIVSQKQERERGSALAKEISNLREQASKPTGNYASQEDLKRLFDAIKEVDRKRVEDNEKLKDLVSKEMLNLKKTLSAAVTTPKKAPSTTPQEGAVTDKPGPSSKGFKYVIEKNDTLGAIVKAYAEKNIKVTTDQILKANPGLNPNKLRLGQEIWIPAPVATKGEG